MQHQPPILSDEIEDLQNIVDNAHSRSPPLMQGYDTDNNALGIIGLTSRSPSPPSAGVALSDCSQRQYIQHLEEENRQLKAQIADDTVIKQHHASDIDRIKREAELLHEAQKQKIIQEYQVRLDQDVKTQVEHKWNTLKALNSFGVHSNTPSLIGVCGECSTVKAQLAQVRLEHAQLKGYYQRSAACVHCAITKTQHDSDKREAFDMYAKLTKEIEELKEKNTTLESTLKKQETDHSGLVSMLLQKNEDASQLQQENAKILAKSTCANCLIFEQQAHKAMEEASRIQLQATDKCNELQAEIKHLKYHGKHMMEGHAREIVDWQRKVWVLEALSDQPSGQPFRQPNNDHNDGGYNFKNHRNNSKNFRGRRNQNGGNFRRNNNNNFNSHNANGNPQGGRSRRNVGARSGF